jgi:predicted transcriptional regulator of viral defense system
MEFEELLHIVGQEPVFPTGLLLAGDVDPDHIRRQLVRWADSGKVYQLRRGLYALAPPYQQVKPHPFLVANHLVRPSYVSLQSALAYYGMIPEYVPTTTSVTTDRPRAFDTPLGKYSFRHIKKERFFAYRVEQAAENQEAFLAVPEKALLDQVYLRAGGDAAAYLKSLRLQNLDQLDTYALKDIARRAGSPKLERAAENIISIAEEGGEYEGLSQETG